MNNLNRKEFLGVGALTFFSLLTPEITFGMPQDVGKKIGIIGLDTSHSVAFAKAINADPAKYKGYHVAMAYPYGSKTIASSFERIPKYIEEIKTYGVEIAESIQDLLTKVDAVMLETNDGRLHLAQAEEVLKAKKIVFIDKPLAASYKDAAAIFDLAKKYDVPFFSSSSLRYITGMTEVLSGKYGKVLGADVYSPASLESSHPDFFWYGIHGVEILFTAMGIGCKTISRTHTADADTIVGVWEDGRIGTVRGTRKGKAEFGGTIFCEKGAVKLGEFVGYNPLLDQIVNFFDTRKVPFDPRETLEICAFIQAADVSKVRNGQAVELKSITQ